jgi:hypothetical protein
MLVVILGVVVQVGVLQQQQQGTAKVGVWDNGRGCQGCQEWAKAAAAEAKELVS